VAYFLIDAMRFEMARELANHLPEALEMTVRPAIGALPTITPIGMAALLPGASTGFSVVPHKGKIGAVVEGRQLGDWPERWKLLQGKVPGVVELPLGKVSELSAKRLSSVINGAPLVVVRSQELDALGEGGDTGLARQVMDTVLGNIARAVRKLSTAGVRRLSW
jgi:PglZ domain